jgi:diacylglycerol kinase
MKKKIMAAGLTLAVMALIRTDAGPALWQAALVSLMFYEINNAVIEAVCSEIRRHRRKKQRIFEKYNLKRWAEVDFVEHAYGRYIEITS